MNATHRLALVLALGAAALTACGAGDIDDAVSDAVEPSVEGAPAAAFPVTIEHKYGETTIPEQPERVVTVGFADQDALLALGVSPVGIRDWYGEQPFATWPWATTRSAMPSRRCCRRRSSTSSRSAPSIPTSSSASRRG